MNLSIHRKLLPILLVLLTFMGCDTKTENNSNAIDSPENGIENPQNTASIHKINNSFSVARYGLTDVQLLDSSIQVDLKYASEDNFMHKRVYFALNKAYLQQEVALRFVKCQQYLKRLNPNYSLLIYDAVRPLSVQKMMWKLLDSIPVAQRVKFVSNPKNGSVHNYAAAVDVTICDADGIALDMGAGYDDIREIAYPNLEWKYLAIGELTQIQVDNRKLLRQVMASQQFRNIPTEWWHFNACSRDVAKVKYELVY